MKKRAGDHPRNTKSMRESANCGAKTRSGTACQAPAVAGKRRCRVHGGAKNRNALKHGAYTREMLDQRKELSQLLREARALLNEIG